MGSEPQACALIVYYFHFGLFGNLMVWLWFQEVPNLEICLSHKPLYKSQTDDIFLFVMLD